MPLPEPCPTWRALRQAVLLLADCPGSLFLSCLRDRTKAFRTPQQYLLPFVLILFFFFSTSLAVASRPPSTNPDFFPPPFFSILPVGACPKAHPSEDVVWRTLFFDTPRVVEVPVAKGVVRRAPGFPLGWRPRPIFFCSVFGTTDVVKKEDFFSFPPFPRCSFASR